MMFTGFFARLFAGFGIVVENRSTASPPGTTPVRNCAAITSTFLADAARQQSESMFFNQGVRPRVVIENNSADLGADPRRR
jgi:hypothetical protein